MDASQSSNNLHHMIPQFVIVSLDVSATPKFLLFYLVGWRVDSSINCGTASPFSADSTHYREKTISPMHAAHAFELNIVKKKPDKKRADMNNEWQARLVS